MRAHRASEDARMQVDESRDGDVLVLSLSGRLDAVSSPAVEARLLDAVRRSSAVVLDLSGLDYVSSAGLRILLKTAKEAKAAQSRFALAALRPAVHEVFEVSGFFSILAAYPSLAEAVAAVR
jgi:anti-anti-sigma factor